MDRVAQRIHNLGEGILNMTLDERQVNGKPHNEQKSEGKIEPLE